MVYRGAPIKTVHLEVTERCNAACPACGRNQSGDAPNPHLTNAELNLSQFCEIFERPFLNQLEKLFVCGNFGDPAMANSLQPIFEFLRSQHPQIRLSMNTHGAVRSADWWRALAPHFTGPSCVKFSIDGLADTNAVYRRNTRWELIERNVRAFTEAGGIGEWQYLVFGHNEHQIDEARKLAGEWGLARFTIKRSTRFMDSATGRPRPQLPILNAQREQIGHLSLPSEPKHINPAFEASARIGEASGGMERYYRETEIRCRVAKERSLYVSARGLVLPCCWLAGQLYPAFVQDPLQQPLWRLLQQHGGEASIDALGKPLAQIVAGPVFQSISDAWEGPSRLRACARFCGSGYDGFGSQLSESLTPNAPSR